MYSDILVPLDGSDVAECVLPHVEAITQGKYPVNVTFLYVVEPLNVPLTDPDFKLRIESEAKAAAGRYLNELIQGLSYKERAHSEVIFGKAAEVILDYSVEKNMDMIMIASHGLSGIRRWIRGSVVDKVLHETGIPILRIRASAPRTPFYKKGHKMTVLVPLDGSELAEIKLGHVTELAKQFGTNSVDIILLRVCEVFSHPHLSYPPPMSMSWEEYLKYETKRCKQICRTYLNGIKKRLKKEGLSVRLSMPVGSAAETIVKYTVKNDIDLIVLSTHGHTGIGQWAFGSVSNKVMKGTSRPVLLIRAKRQ